MGINWTPFAFVLLAEVMSRGHQAMKMRLGRWKWLGVVGATLPLWIPALTNSVAHSPRGGSGAIFFRMPAHRGMGGCRPPTPSWGQAPTLHFSVSALGGSLPSSRQSFTPAGAGTPRYEYRGPTSYQDSAIDPHPNPLPEGEGGELSSAGFPPRIAVRGRYDVAGGGNLLYIGKTPAIDL